MPAISMTLGSNLILLALAGSVCSLIFYAGLLFGKHHLRDYARHLYIASSLCVFAASLLLLYFFLTDRFDVRYVHDYSASNQLLIFKISGFWGGQEGSWLAWLTWISAIGLLIFRRASYAEAPAMAFWASVQTFFLIVLVQRGPFVPTESAVADGLGLNPLLQNYWMAIHPPIVFAGFTLMMVPAAFAVAALIQQDYKNWSRLVYGWTVAGWTILGLGLLLGGIWAYETLGWGGFWGWDPVENASLVPWLVGGALVHGLMLERKKGTWHRMNLFLAYTCFLLVIYATFLTRSGVLADFSVHSFASLGHNNWLVGFMLGYTLLGISLVAFRTRNISQPDGYEAISNKEFLVFLGIVMFGLASVLVTIGMSSPLLSNLLIGQAGNVPIEYYYRVTTPIALVMMALVGLSPLFSWARKRNESSIGNSYWIVGISGSLVLGFLTGVFFWITSGAEIGARVAIGWFAITLLIPNIWSLFETIRRAGWVVSGGHIAHVGVAIFFIGLLASSHNNKPDPDRLALEVNQPRQHLGMVWTFTGTGDMDEMGREPFKITIEKPDGETFTATPIMQTVRDGSTMRHPYIRKSIAGDLYIAPVNQDVLNPPPHDTIAEGESTQLGGWSVELLGFTDMQQFEDGSIQAGVKFLVRNEEEGGEATEVVSSLKMSPGGPEYFPAPLPGSDDALLITQMSVQGRAASILLDGPQYREDMAIRGIIEVTFKPLVWVLWLGSFIIALGGSVSTIRRVREARQAASQTAQEGKTEPAGQKEQAGVTGGVSEQPSAG